MTQILAADFGGGERPATKKVGDLPLKCWCICKKQLQQLVRAASCSASPLSTSGQSPLFPGTRSCQYQSRERAHQEPSFQGCLLQRRNSGRCKIWSNSWCRSLTPILPQIWPQFIRSPSRFWRAPLFGVNSSGGSATIRAQGLRRLITD